MCFLIIIYRIYQTFFNKSFFNEESDWKIKIQNYLSKRQLEGIFEFKAIQNQKIIVRPPTKLHLSQSYKKLTIEC